MLNIANIEIDELLNDLGKTATAIDKSDREKLLQRLRENYRRYRENHREEINARKRNRYAENAETLRADCREYYRKSGIYARKRDYYISNSRKWREENRERKNAYERQRYHDPEVTQRRKERYQANREEINARRREAYARKRAEREQATQENESK